MNRYLLFTIILLYLVFPTAVSAQSNCSSLRYIDTIFHSVAQIDSIYFATAIPYGTDTPQNLYLDIYEPANDTVPLRPLIVYQFGGGFVIGWREEPDIPQFCTYFAQLGYVVATIDYRLGLDPADSNSGVRAFYRAEQDERSAIRFLCQNAQQYGIDTTRIILTGTSAGCFCAFGNAFMTDSDRPVATYGTPLDTSDLGCMDCSGNTNLGHHIPHLTALINMWGAILDTNYTQTWNGVPTVSFQGNLDVLVPYTYGYPFQLPVFPEVYGGVPINQRMDDIGILNSWHPLIGYGHEPELTAPWLNDTIYNYSRVFLYPLLQPHTSLISGDSVVCMDAKVTYSVTNTPGSWYCWQVNSIGNIVADSNNLITVVWNDTGTGEVSVTEMNDIDAQGNPQNFETRIIAHSKPAFTDSAEQLQVSFTNASNGATNYLWTFGNGDSSSVISPVEDYQSPGVYTIILYSSNGLCTDSTSKTISIDSCPRAHFTVQLNGTNAVFEADSTNTLSYFWNFGDGDSATVTSPNVFHSYSASGSYLVSLKVINPKGCEATDTFLVIIKPSGVAPDSQMENIHIACYGTDGCIISTESNLHANIEVFDVTGRRIFEHLAQNNYWLDTGTYATGFYLLTISTGSSVMVRKILKL